MALELQNLKLKSHWQNHQKMFALHQNLIQNYIFQRPDTIFYWGIKKKSVD